MTQAEEERRYIRETQQQGIALAKAKGKYKGGKPKYREDDKRLQLAFKLFWKDLQTKKLKSKQALIEEPSEDTG